MTDIESDDGHRECGRRGIPTPVASAANRDGAVVCSVRNSATVTAAHPQCLDSDGQSINNTRKTDPSLGRLEAIRIPDMASPSPILKTCSSDTLLSSKALPSAA